MIRREAPILVNLPNPSNASGQMPAHTRELARPSKTTNQIEISVVCRKKITCPREKIISKVNRIPNRVQALKALTWLIYFGIVIIPMM
jgi:hypothetical protein